VISGVDDVTYFIGKETIVITKNTGMSLWRETLFDFMSRNSERITTYFKLPPDKVCEIGAQIKL
jgi:KUP system potassium uptake protein